MDSDKLSDEPGPAGGTGPAAETIARLFREHNEALTRFLAVRLRSTQEAQEVAQEAYVRMLNLDQPGAVSFMRSFLYKTAANLAVDRIRSRERRAHLHEARLFNDAADAPGPERSAVGRQEVDIVRRLLAELPPKCRRAFLLNRVEGLDPTEIARQMGVAPRTIRHYILQAFLHCRTGLDASGIAKTHLPQPLPPQAGGGEQESNLGEGCRRG